MIGQEILQEMNDLLDLNLNWDGDFIYEPSGLKGKFFKLFLEAYRNGGFERSANPLFTPDAIKNVFAARMWIGNDPAAPKTKLLNSLLRMWNEWHYALSQIHAKL